MLKKQRNHSLKLLFLIVLALFGNSASATQQVDIPAPDCTFATLEGDSAKGLHALQGDVVYVDFWASWCPPCVKSFPFLNQLEQEFKAQGLRVIGVNLDEKKMDAVAFLSKVPADFEIVTDQTKQCAKDFGVIAMPSSFLIDRHGNVRYIHQGFRQGESEQLRAMVQQFLAEKP
ncbi:MAG: TlpA family protein disulfide reductase [Nitrosomonas sp.]|nr:MAG: TlpA family protein disulfide reductase [Nitrosomonas sp.]